MSNEIELDIISLFSIRYSLDEADPIENLHQDIYDLYHFPERLESSYRDLWLSYIKRKLRQNANNPHIIKNLLERANLNEDATFLELKKIVEQTVRINQSSEVSILKTPLKRYIERLLKA